MFTRYSNIEIPKNYSGNRFKTNIIEDTTMKIHESEIRSDIKTSVSPTYNEWIYANNNSSHYPITDTSQEENLNFDDKETNKNTDEFFEKNYQKFTENNQIDNVNHSTEAINFSEKKNELFDFSQIPEFFKNIKNDDLLLIVLIIFLASDKSVANNEVIILLALLLTLQ